MGLWSIPTFFAIDALYIILVVLPCQAVFAQRAVGARELSDGTLHTLRRTCLNIVRPNRTLGAGCRPRGLFSAGEAADRTLDARVAIEVCARHAAKSWRRGGRKRGLEKMSK